jgi:hypothetical protein
VRVLVPLLLCGAALAQERAFVEVTAAKDTFYVGEQVRLTLRFGYDRDFFRTNAVPLFPRPLDVPVHVQAPWWQEVPGTVSPSGGLTFAINDDLMHAKEVEGALRDGRAFSVFETEKLHLPSKPGDLEVPAPRLRYMYATRFDEDFVTGRVARDPKDAVVTGAPLRLRILPLPEEGCPPEFQGAVGRFKVRAEADRTSVMAGEILRLTLVIEGEGNLDALPPPSLGGIEGFHVYGTVDAGGQGGRTVRYDMAPLSAEVKEVPAIPFAFFDPGPPPAYRVVRTVPIPLEVRGRTPAGTPPPAPVRPTDSGATAVLVIGVLLVAAAAALGRWLLRRPRQTALDPAAARVRVALANLRARAATPGPELADAFAEFLSACLKCPPAAVIGPDLPSRLAERGFPPGLASRAAATLERLVAVRYGGGHAGGEDFAALLSEIEGALSPTVRAGSPR